MAQTEEGRKFEKIALDYLKQNYLPEAEPNFVGQNVMDGTTLEKEILVMHLKIYKRVKDIKKKRIFKELKKFKVVKSVRMIWDWFFTRKIK